jgi:hypothetical protein
VPMCSPVSSSPGRVSLVPDINAADSAISWELPSGPVEPTKGGAPNLRSAGVHAAPLSGAGAAALPAH